MELKEFTNQEYHIHPYQLNLFRFMFQQETISATYWYRKSMGMWSMHGIDPSVNVPSRFRMSLMGGMIAKGRKPRSAAPDLPTILLDNRVVYIGMPVILIIYPFPLITALLLLSSPSPVP